MTVNQSLTLVQEVRGYQRLEVKGQSQGLAINVSVFGQNFGRTFTLFYSLNFILTFSFQFGFRFSSYFVCLVLL